MKAQKALRWWFERQTRALECKSEEVHNGLLQDLYAMRRNVELATTESAWTVTEETKLRQLEQIYDVLERMIDTFSPAYAKESLPLAIQSRCIRWREVNSSLAAELKLPGKWTCDSSPQDYKVIYILDELFKIAVLDCSQPVHACINLDELMASKNLLVEFTYTKLEDLKKIQEAEDLENLQCVFNILIHGSSSYRREDNRLCMQFQWKVHKD